jgi:hypothetical protein
VQAVCHATIPRYGTYPVRKRSSFGRSRGGKFNPTDALPIWRGPQQDAANVVFEALMLRLGVSDLPSYFRELKLSIAICMVICACYGASEYGLTGLAIGGLLGLAGPALNLWGSVMVIGIALFLAVYVLSWMAILFVLGMLLFG